MKSFVTNNLSKVALAAVLVLPLGEQAQWHSFKFNNIPKNQISHPTATSLRIEVNQSASPLIHGFKKPITATDVTVKATSQGQIPQIPKGQIQGSKSFDDFTFRIGLIIKGGKKLNWIQRQMAPKWLVQMEKLMPAGAGVEEVFFLTTCQQKDLLNKKRTHALDSTIKEKCVHLVKEAGTIQWTHQLDKPLEVLGVWVSSDGDQTGARYKVDIKEIKISYK